MKSVQQGRQVFENSLSFAVETSRQVVNGEVCCKKDAPPSYGKQRELPQEISLKYCIRLATLINEF